MSGVSVDPDAISRMTHLAPDGAHRKGDRKSKDKTWSESMWEIRSKAPDDAELSEHLEHLLSRIEPMLTDLREGAGSGARMLFWCAHFTNAPAGFCGGPALGAKLLARIGSLGIDLELQTYAGTDL